MTESYTRVRELFACESKEDLMFNAMVGFTLMISSSCGCLLEVQP